MSLQFVTPDDSSQKAEPRLPGDAQRDDTARVRDKEHLPGPVPRMAGWREEPCVVHRHYTSGQPGALGPAGPAETSSYRSYVPLSFWSLMLLEELGGSW